MLSDQLMKEMWPPLSKWTWRRINCSQFFTKIRHKTGFSYFRTFLFQAVTKPAQTRWKQPVAKTFKNLLSFSAQQNWMYCVVPLLLKDLTVPKYKIYSRTSLHNHHQNTLKPLFTTSGYRYSDQIIAVTQNVLKTVNKVKPQKMSCGVHPAIPICWDVLSAAAIFNMIAVVGQPTFTCQKS